MEQGSVFLEQKKLLNYWRAAIKNESIIGIKIEDLRQYNRYFIPKSLLQDGKLTENTAAKLFAQYKKFLIKIKNTPMDDEDTPPKEEMALPVRISPLVYAKNHKDGKQKLSQKKPFLHPLWIAAYLGESGELFTPYPCLLPPWISREYLQPTYQQQDLITIGNLSDYDAFLDKNSVNGPYTTDDNDDNTAQKNRLSWEELYRYSETMLGKIAPDLSEQLDKNGYCSEPMDKLLLVPTEDNNDHYSTMLLKLLDSLATENEKFTPLLSRYLTLESSIKQPLKSLTEQLEYAATQHLGQMNGIFALAKSQRIALHHLFLTEQEGQILAINGPPGTGKTTLLASIIASLWVRAAIAKKPPPIIVVSSTNNRAITNVIDSFENKVDPSASTTPEGQLANRWIQGVTSFGLYFIRQPKGSYQHYKNSETGTLQALENYLEQKNYYLENFNRFFKLTETNIEKAADILHGKMIVIEASLKTVLKIGLKYRTLLTQHPKYSEKNHLTPKIVHLNTHLERVKIELKNLTQFKMAWYKFTSKNTWYKLITFLLPFFKNQVQIQITRKIETFLFDQQISIDPNQTTIEAHIKNQENIYRSKIKRLKTLIKGYETHLQNLESITEEWENWKKDQQAPDLILETLFNFDSVEDQNHPEKNLLIFLDTKLRYRLFQYTMHYWEAKWLQEILQIRSNQRSLDKTRELNTLRRLAMLAPCFITTMQSGPGFFMSRMTTDQGAEFMKGKIDLLIVDEASQVHPGYGAGMLALAKKACIVGDNLQLPPIVKIPGAVDIGNMRYYQLIDQNEEYYGISDYGANVATCAQNGSGNVMKLAQKASFFQDYPINPPPKQRGLFLTEHRRCVPEIISYCNEFFYQNNMSCNRPPNPKRPFPAMGYAHIPGSTQSIGGSKQNKTEALSIAKWITHKKEAFLSLYPGKSLDQIFGIITPFTSQAAAIKSALQDEGVTLKPGNVGTIHTFQGGEFPVIIFSPTYSYDPKQTNYFFDTERNMLNVAVSRAKDHFFVFGDMEIFERGRNTPSSFLADYLFKFGNELPDVVTVREYYKRYPERVRHINTLEGHRAILRQAFDIAENRILLVSPWITRKALLADNVESLIRSATARKVEVIIYTDKENNFKNVDPKHPPENITLLEQAGATVKVVYNIHSKTLAVDERFFIEGSFNWLSAVRNMPQYEKYEASICCEGKDLKHLIDNFMKRLKDRPLYEKHKKKNKATQLEGAGN